METNINKIPVVLHTMDSYSEFWNPWYYFLKKNVTNHGPIYFLSEEKEPDFIDDITHIKTGKGEWGYRLLNGLNMIDGSLIFYMQEDFWVTKNIEFTDNWLSMFKKDKMDCLRISKISKWYDLDNKLDGLYKFKQNSNYTLSHQFSLWNKDFLMSYVLPDENPWSNELKGSKRINKNEHNIYLYENEFYTPVVRKGVLQEEGIKLLEEYKNDTCNVTYYG